MYIYCTVQYCILRNAMQYKSDGGNLVSKPARDIHRCTSYPGPSECPIERRGNGFGNERRKEKSRTKQRLNFESQRTRNK